MTYNKSEAPSNCDVHWLSFDWAEVIQLLETVSGHAIPSTVRIERDDDGISLEWQTPKVNRPVCPNCGQWINPGAGNMPTDCLNECHRRGFA